MAENPQNAGAPADSAPKLTSPAEYASLKEAAEKRDPTMVLPLPSGANWLVRRPRVETWMMGGRIPQHLVLKALEGARKMGGDGGKEAAEGVLAAMSPDLAPQEAVQVLIFARELVREALVYPKIRVLKEGEDVEEVRANLKPDEILADQIHPLDFWFVFRWASAGSPGVPVETGKGATTLEAVETFRPGERPSDAGADRGGVGLPAE